MINMFNINKNDFITRASHFLNTLFEQSLKYHYGEIEIRSFPREGKAGASFYNSPVEAAEKAFDLCKSEIDVYFGVNPRDGRGGRKENVKYLTSFHSEIDYGEEGHQKPSRFRSYEEALNAIRKFLLEPTIIIHSGGGVHCYWVLTEPLQVQDHGIETLEGINKSLSLALGGDPGTQDISRLLRVPGTYNFKNPNNPKPVTMVTDSGRKYSLEDFSECTGIRNEGKIQIIDFPDLISEFGLPSTSEVEIDRLPIPARIKTLIRNGNDGSYPSRSEADMAVV